MTKEELKEIVTRHHGMGFDWVDIDGWKVRMNENCYLSCVGVTENLFKVYDVNFLIYNRVYLLRVDFSLLPFETFILHSLSTELSKLINDLYKIKSNCIILEFDNCINLDSSLSLRHVFGHKNVNIIYLRDTKYLDTWFNNCDYHMLLAPKLESLHSLPKLFSYLHDEEEELVYYLPKLKDNSHLNYLENKSKYKLITNNNGQSLLNKLSFFGNVTELVIDEIDDYSVKKFEEDNFKLQNVICEECNGIKMAENLYFQRVVEMEDICKFINSLK